MCYHTPMRVFLTLILLTCPAAADVIGQSRKTVDCYCTDKSGARVELGQTICLQVDGRMFMAQCQMSQNVPMWRELSSGCFIGDAQTPLQSAANG